MSRACSPRRTWPILIAVAVAVLPGPAGAAELRVMISGGFLAAYLELAPGFERATGHTLVTTRGASMGTAPSAIPSRLARGEPVDVVIMVGEALDDLAKRGTLAVSARVDLAHSRIGLAVRAGAPRPDIGSADAFRRAMLEARSIAYSSSASGVYLSTELFPRLGIADQVRSKSRVVATEPVAAVVARGEAEVGLQQLSELLPVAGIDYVGPLPAEIQKVTVFSGAIATAAKHPEAARRLLDFLASPAAASAIARTALDPVR